MHIYKIGYHSYEESEYAIMMHSCKFSNDELHELVSNATIRALQGVLDGKYDPYIGEEGISYEHLHEHVVTELHASGFVDVEFSGEWSCFGWPSLTENRSWKGQRGEILDKLFESIPLEIKHGIYRLIMEENGHV